jgi:O-antigen/teichoic acid export membrane protein
MELLNRLLSFVLVVTVVWVIGVRTPGPVFAAALLGVVVSSLITLRKLHRFCETPLAFSSELFRKNFRLGWKAYLSAFFAFLVIRIDLLMVHSMLGSAPAGYYSIVGTMADYVLLLPAAVAAILFPKLSGMSDDPHKWQITCKAAFVTGAGLMLLLVLLGVTVKFIISLMFGAAFAPAVPAFLLLAPGVLFLGVEVVLVQYLNSRGFPLSVVMMWIIVTAANVLLNIWAIPKHGINGAAVVSSISYFLALAGIGWIAFKSRRRWYMESRGQSSRELNQPNNSFCADNSI